MENAQIIRPDLDKEFWTEENCFILESSNSSHDQDVSIARARVAIGEQTRWHLVKETIERYYILEGEGLVEVGELEPTLVKPGDVVLIPKSCPQRIKNTGSVDLVFLAICSPRFVPEAYEDIES